MSDSLLHVVLVKFRDEVPKMQRVEMKACMGRLGAECGGETAGIIGWHADWNLDQRKGYCLMSAAVFTDRASFQQFRAHPAHKAFAARMSEIADWIVGDLPMAEG